MSTKYNPYSVERGIPTVNRSSSASSQVRLESKLDKVTRSRNALIIALAVFVIAFLACLIFILLNLKSIIPEPPPPTEESIQVISVLKDKPYGEELSDTSSFSFGLMNSTFCPKIVDAAKSAGTVISCNCVEFSNANPGVKGKTILIVALDGKTADERFQLVSEAIVSAAATDSNWVVEEGDVTLMT